MTAFPTKPLGRNPLEVPIFGMGTAPLGNLYRNLSEEEAISTVQFAYESGVRLYDTAPLYGNGTSEIRLGKALKGTVRDHLVISSKVGRVLNDDLSGFTFNYSRDGVMRSIEGSLERLQMDYIDIVLVHDPDADEESQEQQAIDEAFPTLVELREQGVIKAVGSGMNQWQMLSRFADAADVDMFLLAGRYTLLEQTSLDFLQKCEEKGIGIFLGGVYNSGILATGPKEGAKFNYADAPADVLEKARKIQTICENYDVPLNVAAIQFPTAHPAVTSLVIGVEGPNEISANIRALQAPIPPALWDDLYAAGLVEEDAPAPAASPL